MLSGKTFGFGELAHDIEGDIARAATGAMRDTAPLTRDELRQQTRSAGLGDKLPNTWTARSYPDGEKNSINPAGVVYSRAPEIMDAFTRGATIRPVAGSKFLWIPTNNVPRGRARMGRFSRNAEGQMRPLRHKAGAISPEECESRFNTDFVVRKGRAGRLLAYMDLLAGRARRNGSALRPVICRCGHRGVLEGRKLARYYLVHMWDGRLHMVGDHLRCTRCRARSPSIRLTADAPTSDFGPRDERGWKLLVRRLRG